MDTDTEEQTSKTPNPSQEAANKLSDFERLAQAATAANTPADYAGQDQRDAALREHEAAAENPMGYGSGTDLADINNSVGQRLSAFAGRFGAMISRNKGKSAATTLGIGAVLVLGTIGGGTLSLVSAKNNAEKKFTSITNTVLDNRFSKIAYYGRSKIINSALKNFKLEANTKKLAEAMDNAGYELLDDGKGLVLPADESGTRRILTDAADVESEIKSVAKESLPGGLSLKNVRQRSKATKLLSKRLGIASSAAVDGVLAGAEDVATDDAEAAVKKSAREATISEATDESFDSIKDAEKELGDSLDSADKADATKEAKDLLDDGALDATDNIPRDSAGELTEDIATEVGIQAGQSVTSKLGGALKGALPEIMDRTCQAAQAARTFYVLGLISKKVNLIKFASVFASNADSIVTGRVDGKLLKGFMDTIQTSPKTGKNWMQSAGMLNITNSGGALAVPSAADNSYFRTDRQDVGGFLTFLVNLASARVAGFNACSVIRNPATQTGLTVGEYAITAVITALSAGTAAPGIVATEQGAKQATSKLIAKAIGKAIITGITVEAGMYVGQQYMKSYVGNIFASTMATFSKGEGGPFTGNGFSAGYAAYSETSGRNMGMRPLDKLAYVELSKDVRSEQRTELAKMSLYDRLISIKPSDHNSLATLALTQSPIAWSRPVDVATNTIRSLANFSPVSQVQSFASAAASGSAFAEDGQVQTDSNGYVVDTWGNYIVGNQLDDIDPMENISYLDNKGYISAEGEPVDGTPLAKYLKDCAQVDIHQESATNKVKADCVSSEARRYQAYLADYTNAAGLDAAYNPVYAEEDTATPTATSTAGGSAGQDTSQLPCPAGGGSVFQDYGPGRVPTVKVKICGIGSAIPEASGVNASAAAGAASMIAKAKEDGLSLTGSSFRSYDRQKELRVAHGCADDSIRSSNCSPPTAKPGNSQHEVGLAIDFNSCRTHSTACYQWLSKNAATFGFKNLPSEAWHWSTSGS